MRILHVNKFGHRRGGAEAYMLDVAELQAADGHHVEFFAMEHAANQPARYSAWFPPRVDLEPPPRGSRARASTAARMLWSRSAARGMAEVLRRYRPDVVHLHNIYHQLSPSVLRPVARAGVPTVMTLHDYKLVCPSYRMLAGGGPCDACLGRRFHNAVRVRCKNGSATQSAVLAAELAAHTWLGAYGGVGRFVCPSRFMLATMQAGQVYPERLRYLPHFVDPGVPTSNGAGGYALVAGRLSPEKGVDVAIDALRRLPGLALVVAGDGPERGRLQTQARDLGSQVRFTGQVDREGVQRLMAGAAAVVVPSRWYENQPMIVLEAFAAAVPVVTSDLGGLPELVVDGVNGAVVPPGDAAALAGALRRVVGDTALGTAARRLALVDYSPRRHLDGLAAIYAEADR